MTLDRSGKSFRYILRYLIDPDFRSDERIDELIEFCRSAKVEEVMMFLTAEELSAGHPTSVEIENYVELGRRLNSRLAAVGVDLSLNPWSTLHHNGRGRRLRKGQDFRLMVGENGVVSTVTVCPLCARWQKYLIAAFSQMIQGIEPVTLWIEDDWRLRNHDAALGWGGCFCDEHLRRFSERVGESVSRQELLTKMLAPGEPHPWRRVWLDLSEETLLEPLRLLSAAVHRDFPKTRLALMSSNPDAHAAEGRNWERMQGAIKGNHAFISRPNMGPYTQSHALQSPPSVTRLTIANLKGAIEVYPELENSPRCGPYSKSRAYSIFQTLQTAAMGAKGITINHYDMLGNGISLDPRFAHGLACAKSQLNSLSKLDLDDRCSHGVQVLYSPDIARHIDTLSSSPKMDSLSQNSRVWADTCAILGISHHFSSAINSVGRPILVNAQTLLAFTDDEIHRLIGCHVIFDAISVEILLRRGFGKAIGVESAERASLNDTGYSYEQIGLEGCGIETLPFPRMTAQRCSSWLLRMQADPGAEILSSVRDFNHEVLFPGSVLYRNTRGGQILSLAYPLDGKSQFFMGFFNVYRKAFLQEILFRFYSSRYLACLNEPALQAYRGPTNEGVFLAAFNPTDDVVNSVSWILPEGEFFGGTWEKLEKCGSWQRVEPSVESRGHYDRFHFAHKVEPLTASFIHFRP